MSPKDTISDSVAELSSWCSGTSDSGLNCQMVFLPACGIEITKKKQLREHQPSSYTDHGLLPITGLSRHRGRREGLQERHKVKV